MISKKYKLKKKDWQKGKTKFAVEKVGDINIPTEVDGVKEKVDKKLRLKKERYQEHLKTKADRKILPDNDPLRIELRTRVYPKCKNDGCDKQRRHSSARCGQC